MGDTAAPSSSLDSLADVAAARARHPPRLVVEGVGGSGKTALLDQLARRWHSEGHHVLWAQGRRSYAEPPGAALGDLTADAPGDAGSIAEALEQTLAEGGVAIVDDAQWVDELSLRALAMAAGRGLPLVVSHRPTLRPETAALLVELTDSGSVLVLGPLDVDGIAVLAKETAGQRSLSHSEVALLHQRCGGRPGWARQLMGAGPGDEDEVMSRISSRVVYELALLGGASRRVVTALALGASVEDHEVLASQLGSAEAMALGDVLFEVRAAGLLDPDERELVPVVAEAVRALTPAAERRRLEVEVAPGRLWLRRSEAALLSGEAAEAVTLAERAVEQGADPWRARRVAAVGLVAQGLFSPAGRRLASLAAGPRPLEALDAVPVLVAGGDAVEARRLLATATDAPARSVLEDVSLMVAQAMVATVESPLTALRTMVEACRLAEAVAPATSLTPFTPHALAATVASALGRLPLAQRLVERGRRYDVGGPLHRVHHRLLDSWMAMRAGRWSTAEEALNDEPLGLEPGSLLAVTLDAALARRSGDVGRLGAAWERALDVLVGWKPDLLSLEVVGELAATAARLGRWEEISPVARDLGSVVDALGRPPLWEVPRRWFGLQAAVAADDPASTSRRATELAALAASDEANGAYARSLSTVADVWATTLAGQIDGVAVHAAARALQDLSLPWEASRLLGAAAIRAEDSGITRRFLEEARDLRAGLSSPSEGELGGLGVSGVLSERERQVAAGVAEGLTYKELGERLFISPKTVEHHVAKIRQKLGISTRSEMLSALRATRGRRG